MHAEIGTPRSREDPAAIAVWDAPIAIRGGWDPVRDEVVQLDKCPDPRPGGKYRPINSRVKGMIDGQEGRPHSGHGIGDRDRHLRGVSGRDARIL
jgi:hypothetical protein